VANRTEAAFRSDNSVCNGYRQLKIQLSFF
jgi:hypothetical protein